MYITYKKNANSWDCVNYDTGDTTRLSVNDKAHIRLDLGSLSINNPQFYIDFDKAWLYGKIEKVTSRKIKVRIISDDTYWDNVVIKLKHQNILEIEKEWL